VNQDPHPPRPSHARSDSLDSSLDASNGPISSRIRGWERPRREVGKGRGRRARDGSGPVAHPPPASVGFRKRSLSVAVVRLGATFVGAFEASEVKDAIASRDEGEVPLLMMAVGVPKGSLREHHEGLGGAIPLDK